MILGSKTSELGGGIKYAPPPGSGMHLKARSR